MGEKWLAGIALAACVVYLLGMLIGERRVARLRAAGYRVRTAWRRLVAMPRSRRAARREAEKAIERARRKVERDGNVYRPKSFERKPPDEPLH